MEASRKEVQAYEKIYRSYEITKEKIVKICTTPLDWIQRKLKVEL